MMAKRNFWISLCLVNLCIVALLGFLLRSKILFPIPFIDYRNLLSAHSHFAFAGWAGLVLMVMLIYELLPLQTAQKRFYQWILGAIEISSLGMAFTFPFVGYNGLSIFFSSLYIVVYFVFAPVFIKDVLKYCQQKSVRLLSISAIASLIISSIGPLGLVYILVSHSGNSLLYRDSIYTFLHFQYNGFFTLSVFALLYNFLHQQGVQLSSQAKRFAVFISISVIPSLFLSLLWHNNMVFYIIAAVGSVLLLASFFYFLGLMRLVKKSKVFKNPFVHILWLAAALSFALKMLLNTGTVFPQLGNAVYGARPVIIGFLHLVFLGYLTFFILSRLVAHGLFTIKEKTTTYPFIVFAAGIIANEVLLMLQGLGILFKTNSYIYNWLLWGAAILLFAGTLLILNAWLQLARQIQILKRNEP